MTTEGISAVLDLNSTDLFTKAIILHHENETTLLATHALPNASTVYELNSNASTSTVAASVLEFNSSSDVVTNISVTATTYDRNLSFHDVTSIATNLTDSISSSTLSFTRQQNSSKVYDISSAVSEHVDYFESTTQYSGDDIVADQSSTVGIAVGVSVAVVLLVAALIVLFFFFRRKRLLKRKHSEIVMENPQYNLERNSTLPKNFDLTMHTGPMVRSHLNNNSAENLTKTNGKRKKDAPRPPIYKPTAGKDSTSKRKAPLPPRNSGYEDLYEKDSAAGSSEALELSSFYAVDNQNADPVTTDNENLHSKPLLESFHPQKKSPKRSSRIDAGEKAIEADANKDEEDKTEDEEMKTALLGKDKMASNQSLDSYDKTKNPFFSG